MSKILTGKEVIELITQSCDLTSGLVIEVRDAKYKRKFYRITRTDEAFQPKGSQYVATLVGELTDEIF